MVDNITEYSNKASLQANEEDKNHDELNSLLLRNKSHEIRTYMTRIISMTDLTLMTEVTEEQREYLTIVKTSTRLLLEVLNEIIEESRNPNKADLE